MSAYDEPTEFCPYCGSECECDWVDVGIGSMQCGPYHCENCGASEIGPEYWDWIFKDRNGETIFIDGYKTVLRPGHPFSEKELETHWYDPVKAPKVSPYANTVNGVLVDHKTAKAFYRLGLLDEKDV